MSRICQWVLWLNLFWVVNSAHAAQWYEVQGSAAIVNNQIEQAKEKAMQNALRKGIDLAGGQFSSIEEVSNGILTGRQLTWQSRGDVAHVEVIRERQNKQRYEVTLRLLIQINQEQSCQQSHYRPAVVLTPFEAALPEHLSLGQIQGIDQSSAFRFGRLLMTESKRLWIKHQVASFQGIQQRINQGTDALGAYAKQLATIHQAQYVIAGVFHDLSPHALPLSRWTPWAQPQYQRHLELSLYLLDGISGELMTTASVTGQSDWPFQHNDRVDVHSERFWQSDFGQLIEANMKELIFGIDEKTQCEPLKGYITRVHDNQITINLGKKHQIHAKSLVSVLQKTSFLDEYGHYHHAWSVHPETFEIQEIFESSAIIGSSNNAPLVGIQEKDLIWIQ